MRPRHTIKENFTNDYRTRRCRFIVLSLSPCISNDEEIYILMIIFKDSRCDPLRDSDITEGDSNTDWNSRISNVIPEKGGSPNQDSR